MLLTPLPQDGWGGGDILLTTLPRSEFGIQKGYQKVRWLIKEAGKAVNKFSV